MRIGFTGSSRHVTASQLRSLWEQLKASGASELHHGDCVEADAKAHDAAVALGIEPVVHPPSNPKKRAFKLARKIWPAKPYRQRNQDVVCCADRVLACPSGEEARQPRSGTWMVVRMARRAGIPVTLIWPDGRVTRDL